MEERRLNEKESLELITRMMQNTKMNLEVGSGNSLISWGISVLIANTVVCILLYFTESPLSFWAWMLAPVIGTLWEKLTSNKRPVITTKIDKMVSKLWLYITITTVLLPIVLLGLVFLTKENLIISGVNLMALIPFAEMLIVSLGLISTVIIIDFKPLRIGGIIGVILSIALLSNSIHIHSGIFGLWAIISMIVPGIKLNYFIKSKRNA
ncbi:MAG: hypothetical protein R3Y26_03155 [Rikenellaceae bacterium]